MKIKYKDCKFRSPSLNLISIVNTIIEEYEESGYDLTLRQLYYQLVSRDHIENSEKAYKNVGILINKARLAGLIDWVTIEDRTRNLKKLSHWSSTADIIASVPSNYRVDIRQDQDFYVEVWVEKEALAGIVEKAANANDVPFLSCRGYLSQSEMWNAAANRLSIRHKQFRQTPVIIYLGDHDPSGIDMSRDIVDRLQMFNVTADLIFDRIALNMDQIESFNPPPNPTKLSDSRAKDYIAQYGSSSWELDALSPELLHNLISNRCKAFISNFSAYTMRQQQITEEKRLLQSVADNWQEIVKQYK